MIEHSLCVAGSVVSSGLIPGVMYGHWWRIVGFLPCSCIQLWGHSVDPMLIPDKECFIYLRNILGYIIIEIYDVRGNCASENELQLLWCEN